MWEDGKAEGGKLRHAPQRGIEGVANGSVRVLDSSGDTEGAYLCRINLSGEQPEEGGLAGAVWPDDGHARLAVKPKVAVAVKDADRPVGVRVSERDVGHRDARGRQHRGRWEFEP